jgi:hypothetical protein
MKIKLDENISRHSKLVINQIIQFRLNRIEKMGAGLVF